MKVNAKTKWRKMEDGSGRVEYPEYPSAAVEEAIVKRLSLMERRGIGFGKILDAYQFESEKRGRSIVPQFLSSSSEFHVILPNLNYKAPELDALNGGKNRFSDADTEIAAHSFSSTLAQQRSEIGRSFEG